jgi:hypothetical protein
VIILAVQSQDEWIKAQNDSRAGEEFLRIHNHSGWGPKEGGLLADEHTRK